MNKSLRTTLSSRKDTEEMQTYMSYFETQLTDNNRSRDTFDIVQLLNEVIETDIVWNKFSILSELSTHVRAVSQATLNQFLLSACKKGNTFLVKCLLLCDVDVNCKDDEGNTPLMICALLGYSDIVRMLIEKRADVNCTNKNGDTALILSASKSGSTDVFRMLLELEDVKIDCKNSQGETCLTKSLQNFDFNNVQGILRKVKSLQSLDHNYNRMLSEARNTSVCLNIDSLFQYIGEEIFNNKSALLSSASKSDLKNLKILLYFKITTNTQDLNTLLTEILDIFKRKTTEINTVDNEIVRTLINYRPNGETLHFGQYDKYILAQGVRIGNSELLELLCQHVNTHGGLSEQFKKEVWHHGLSAICDCSCSGDKLLNILLRYKQDLMSTFRDDIKLLEKALRSGNTHCVEMFINQDSHINLEECLNITIESNQDECLFLILERMRFKENTNVMNISRFFHKAIKLERVAIIELLSHYVDINEAYHHKTALMLCKNPEIANILLTKNAKVDVILGPRHYNAFLFLFSSQNICSTNIDLYVSNKKTERLLKLAAMYLKHGANVEDKDDKGRTALMLVSQHNQVEQVLTFLLASGANPNNQDSEGRTALHFAVSGSCHRNVEILLDYKANVNITCHNGTSCLHLCVTTQNIGILQCLIEHCADVDKVDTMGNTPLLLAARSPVVNIDITRCLTLLGCILDQQDTEGKSAMMLAAENGCVELVLMLSEKGASVDVRSSGHQNVVDILVNKIASSQGNVKDLISCAKQLVHRGASAAGVKPENLFSLIRNGQHNLVQVLITGGLSPSECILNEYSSTGTVSPFCYALLKNNLELAKYFWDISFLTKYDISNKRRLQAIRCNLKQNNYTECLKFVETLYNQPLPLFQLCKISLSSQFTSGLEDEADIKMLQLLEKFYEGLMFKIPGRQKINLEDVDVEVSMDTDVPVWVDDDQRQYYSADDATDLNYRTPI